MRAEIQNDVLKMGWMVNVDVEDHKYEDYNKTTVVDSFEGSGHTLGSATSNIEIAPAVTAQANTAKVAASTDVDTADDEKLAKEKLKVDNIAHHNTANPFGCSFQFQPYSWRYSQIDTNSSTRICWAKFSVGFLISHTWIKDKKATIEVAGKERTTFKLWKFLLTL